MVSKAARRRAKKRAQAMGVDLAPVQRREKNGQKQRETTTKSGVERNADAVALKARARHMGKSASKWREMRDEALSEQAGRALRLLCDPDTADRLLGHYKSLTAAEARYHAAIGRGLYPKTARIEMMPERFETRSDDSPDLRTEEDRYHQAVTAWMRWQGYIGRIDKHMAKAIYDAYRREAVLVDAGKVKPAGRRFVAAMIELDRKM